MSAYEIGPDGLQKIDVAENSIKNRLPLGSVLRWGGNMAWPSQDYAVAYRRETSFGVNYGLISLATYKAMETQSHSIKLPTEKVWHGQHFFLTGKILSVEEMEELKKWEETKKSSEEEKKNLEVMRKETEIQRIKREYSYLRQTSREESSRITATKNIRAQLKRAFPNVKFSVKSKSYSGGNSINIGWTDGPTTVMVQGITDKYQEGSFDGMTDSYNYNYRQVWTDVFGGAKYVFENRSYSETFLNSMAVKLGYKDAIYDKSTGLFSGQDYENSRFIFNEASKVECK